MCKCQVHNTDSICISRGPLWLVNVRIYLQGSHGMPPQPWIIPSKTQRGVLWCCQYSLCRVSCALGNREPGFPEKSWSTLISSEFAKILMQPRASWALEGWPRLVWLICLVERGDLLQGGLVSLRNKKKNYTNPKKKREIKKKKQ